MATGNTIEIARHSDFRLMGSRKVDGSVILAEKIDKSAKGANVSKAEFVHNALLNACELTGNFDAAALQFSDEGLEEYGDLSEQDLINLTLQSSTLIDLAKKCLVSHAKRAWQNNQKTNRDGSERKRATASATQEKIHALVIEQIAKNNKAENWYEKRAINTSFIQKGGREDNLGRTTAMPNLFGFSAVKTYLETHEETIAEHHHTHKMRGNFNQKVSNELKRMAKNS